MVRTVRSFKLTTPKDASGVDIVFEQGLHYRHRSDTPGPGLAELPVIDPAQRLDVASGGRRQEHLLCLVEGAQGEIGFLSVGVLEPPDNTLVLM